MLARHQSRSSQSGRAVVVVLIAVLAVGATLVLLSRRDVAAQPPGQPGMGMPGPMPFFPFPGGGGGPAMVGHESHIYVAQGGTLYKIDPENMTVVGEVQFVRPPAMPMGPPQPPGRPGAPE